MALIVQKYGGTSVGSPERIQAVADKVIQYRNQGHQLVVVVSAMSGETDRLLGLAGSICKRPVPRELDVLLATGEQATIALLSMALQEQGCPARSYTGPQVQILTDSAHNKARIQAIDAARVRQDLAEGRVVVVATAGDLRGRATITVRSGKGDKDRVTLLPESLKEALELQIDSSSRQHRQDLLQGFGEVYLPHALARKYPSAAKELGTWRHGCNQSVR
mgnify:CR=1 FL=1